MSANNQKHQPKKKKPNKEQRERKRAENAEIYESGFSHGYSMGYNQGGADKEKEMLSLLQSERIKALSTGR